jgi:uncharacterized membrane protein YkoI
MFKGLSTMFTTGTMLLAAGAMTVTDSAYGEPNKVEMAAVAKVAISEAIKTASEAVSGTVIEAELEQKHDRLTWKIEVVTPERKIMDVRIDAEIGSVIAVEEEKAKAKKVKRH